MFLHNYVKNPFTTDAYVNITALEQSTRTAVRMLNRVLDVNYLPDKKYQNYQENMRAIGLGVTGLADMLAMCGLNYATEEAREFVDELMNRILNWAYDESTELAKVEGVFPFCNNTLHANTVFVKKRINIAVRSKILKYGIRNSKITCTAPCGSISLTFGNNCSSGIEPIFSLSYERKVKIGGQEESNIRTVEMTDYAYGLYKTMVANGERVDYSEGEIFPTALNISVDDHIDMLHMVARNVCMSTSKTLNIPSDFPYEDFKNVYMKCWKLGIKGCTTFRPTALRPGILSTKDDKKQEEQTPVESTKQLNYIEPISRKTLGVTHGKTYCKRTACGTLYITVNCNDNNDVVETFVHTSKGGICQANINAINRMISLNLRSGVKIDEVIDQLSGITCQACSRVFAQGTKLDGISCPDIIGRTIKEFSESIDNTESTKSEPVIAESTTTNTDDVQSTKTNVVGVCPECGEPTEAQSGCVICLSCGWTKCE